MNNSHAKQQTPSDQRRSAAANAAAAAAARPFSTLFTPALSNSLHHHQQQRFGGSTQSPYSPFPFGSPLAFSSRSVLNPRSPNGDDGEDSAATQEEVLFRSINRGRDLYGGKSLSQKLSWQQQQRQQQQ
jgi:hypothetical protein